MNSSKRGSCSTYRRDDYIPPYERLLRRNRRWKPTKVEEEARLRKSCETGELRPFQQPHSYSCYFIHEKTDIFTMDHLIDEAKLLNKFSMDTEGDALSHRPATLQVEFIRQTSPTIIIIIEVQYLPAINSPLFKKIQQLCSIIFTSNNEIYSWGSPTEELEKFIPYQLFSKEIQIIKKNIQDTYDSVQKRSLQSAVKAEFEEYLDKTATLAEWGCGIDLSLSTYIPTQVTGRERTYRIEEEKKYRSILTEYAVNDVFAVTKLSYQMNLINLATPTTIEHAATIHDEVWEQNYEEPSIEMEPIDDGTITFYAPDELSLISDDEERNGRNSNELQKVHEQHELLQWRFDEDPIDEPFPDVMRLHLDHKPQPRITNQHLDLRSLPEVMKLHLDPKPDRQINQRQHDSNRSDERREVHVRHQVKKSRFSDRNPDDERLLTPKQIKNRKKNRHHRANRYRFEVIRHVYRPFTITKIKRIIKSMNIDYVNINKVRQTLFIGLKNQAIVDEVEQQLHHRMFTEQHYQRLYGKRT